MDSLPTAPYVFFDSSRAREPGSSLLCANPIAILTERAGAFVELPSGRVVDPVAWLRAPTHHTLAGFLGYEFGWQLLDVRAARAVDSTQTPRLWVGRFDAVDTVEPSVGTSGQLGEPRCVVSADAYRDAVGRCVQDIYDGELFEVNFTTRFRARWHGNPEDFYGRFRQLSSGAWFGLVHTGDRMVASVSPEEFVRVEDGLVTTRPIKGTRRRVADSEADRAVAEELRNSEKDRAENIMIVDLMRNDLTPVCELGTVTVPAICEVESFAGVHHLVSTVRGELRRGVSPMDVLLRCFPAGSITGAPKLRAMEIAATYETTARGAYTGTMFVCRPDGRLHSNVLIRTATVVPDDKGGADVTYGAGGAVVAESDPEAEWQEALAKCGPLVRLAEATQGAP